MHEVEFLVCNWKKTACTSLVYGDGTQALAASRFICVMRNHTLSRSPGLSSACSMRLKQFWSISLLCSTAAASICA